LPYVYDVRGALVDETVSKGSAWWKARIYGRLEKSAVRAAAHVSAVSEGLAAGVSERYGVPRVSAIRSCVPARPLEVDEDSRARMRESLGFPRDAIVLVYSGGLNYYQQVPEMLDLWHSVADDRRLHYLLLTNETPHVRERPFDVSRFGGRILHRSVPQAEVHGLLSNADVGFLLRAAKSLNAVASPVKAGEYLMAGLAVAISPNVGDASSLVQARDVGAIIPADPADAAAALRELIARLATERDAMRRRARDAALSHYAWTAYEPVFTRFYRGEETGRT
jgi:glycosyltransferase involved in cell wall biosynthesis